MRDQFEPRLTPDGSLVFTLNMQVKEFDGSDPRFPPGLYLQTWVGNDKKTLLGPVPVEMLEPLKDEIVKNFQNSLEHITEIWKEAHK